jgi:methylated-DNA-[protein]-cysteine S-methyltransferase
MQATSDDPRGAPPAAILYSSAVLPIGRVWMARTDRGVISVRLRSSTGGAFLSGLREMLRGRQIAPRRDDASLEEVRRQLGQYFEGTRREFSLPVDLHLLTAFQRRVLEATAQIPFGKVVPYGAIAGAIGKPGASRAVGNALGSNPVPILIPCHRVVASGGRIGGFTGGLGLKRKLLEVEGVVL